MKRIDISEAAARELNDIQVQASQFQAQRSRAEAEVAAAINGLEACKLQVDNKKLRLLMAAAATGDPDAYEMMMDAGTGALYLSLRKGAEIHQMPRIEPTEPVEAPAAQEATSDPLESVEPALGLAAAVGKENRRGRPRQ